MTKVTPNAGRLAGGETVTITGSGFLPVSIVRFGGNDPGVRATVVNPTTLQVMVPPGVRGPASISVWTSKQPYGAGPPYEPYYFASLYDAYHYLSEADLAACARVVAVEPLTVIEGTDSVLTLRGRGLKRAYDEGMIAFRGPDRARFEVSDVVAGRDPGGDPDKDTLALTVRVTASPPLAPLERVAVQIWASCRPEAYRDLVVETSRQTFTVLPRDVPVPLAYTPLLAAGGPTMVMVAGRNLQGASLSLVGAGADLRSDGSGPRFQATWQDDGALVGLVDLPAPSSAADGGPRATAAAFSGDGPPRLVVRDAAGRAVGTYDLRVVDGPAVGGGGPRDDASGPLAGFGSLGPDDPSTPGAPARSSAAPAAAGGRRADGDAAAALTPVPGQRLVGPSEGDSYIYDLRRGPLLPRPVAAAVLAPPTTEGAALALAAPGIGFGLEFEVVDLEVSVPLLDETRLVPFFDGGGDALGKLPVAGRVGQLFQLRGMALLVSLRAELRITVRVYVVVRWYPAFGYFNEYGSQFPGAFGTISVSIFVQVIVRAALAFLVALVRGDGSLRVLASALLTLGVDVLVSGDNRRLTVRGGASGDVTYFARVRALGPASAAPCAGVARLASDNGQSRFTDAFGGVRMFLFGEAPGRCCVRWDYDLDLVRFREGRGEEVVQGRFQPAYCFDVAPSETLLDVYIDSDPPPTGSPPTLVLQVGETATLRAFGRLVNAQTGQQIPGPPKDLVRDYGADVRFHLENPPGPPVPPDVLDPDRLAGGTAVAIRAGANRIGMTIAVSEVRIPDDDTPSEVAIDPRADILFDILGALGAGRFPGVRIRKQLPVRVTPIPTEVKGVDNKYTVERIAGCLASSGYVFVGRYYNVNNQDKNLTRSEAKAYTRAGLKIAVFWQNGFPTGVSYFTADQGRIDAERAQAYGASQIGQPAGSAIYFAVDYDADAADVDGPITAYFAAAKAVLEARSPGYQVGVYGSGALCMAMIEKGLARYGWLAAAPSWRGREGFTNWSVRQAFESPVCGMQVDTNIARGEFGAFQVAAGVPAVVDVADVEPSDAT